jgi:TolB protein
MAARRLSDSMCKSFANQKGFACNRIAFVSKKDKNSSELCVCYPDGYDIRQLTGNGKTVVGPRWKDSNTIFYTGIVNAGPQIWEYDCASSRRNLRWSFKGLTTGACVSPDGVKAAVILSFQGNPELYVITGDKFVRLTKTPLASEGQPTWSPDGTKIAYVSNEARRPQIYVVDIATRQKRRLTSRGRENIDPDWGSDGRIAYITKRGGAQVAVMNPAEGDSSAELVTDEGGWEHPSWSRDARHLTVNKSGAIFIVDTLKDGDKPRRVFSASGNFISPVWQR